MDNKKKVAVLINGIAWIVLAVIGCIAFSNMIIPIIFGAVVFFLLSSLFIFQGYECPQCGRSMSRGEMVNNGYKFCPYCGADHREFLEDAYPL